MSTGIDFVLSGFRDGWKGPLDRVDDAAGRAWRCAESCPAAAPFLGLFAHQPVQDRRRGRTGISRQPASPSQVDALVAIGGEDTLGVAAKLHELGVHVVGIPKTIDNDVNATDATIGFDTAIQIVSEASDRLHTTAESHHRALIIEVMGRNVGWIALHAGLAGGART